MGIAIIIPGADFSSNNLGQITFLEDIDVTGIAIVAEESYTGLTFTPTINYTPGTTNQKGVTWEITSGATYATINSSTGVVTILSGASANTITIKATSTYNINITATANISVTYVETPINPTALTIIGDSTVNGQSSSYSITYTPTNTNQLGIIWSIDSGAEYATINETTGIMTILSGANANIVIIRATSTADNTIYATKSITVTFSLPHFNLSNNTLMFKATTVPSLLTLGDASILIGFDSVLGTYRNNGGNNMFNYLIQSLNKANKNESSFLFRSNFTGDYTNMFDSGSKYCFCKKTDLTTPDTCKYLIFSNKHLYVTGPDDTIYTVDFTSQLSTYDFTGDADNFCNGKFIFNVREVEQSILNAISSQTDLNTAITGSTITIGSTLGFLTKFIIIPNAVYTTADDIINNRESAFIDMKFDNNGNPYNAGTGSGEVFFTNN